MDVQDGGVALAFVVAHRLQHPAVDLDAVVVGDAQQLGGDDRFLRQHPLVKVGQLHLSLLGQAVQLLQLILAHGDIDQRLALFVHAVDRALVGGQRGDVAVVVGVVDLGPVALGGDVGDAVLLGHHALSAAQTAVRTDAAAPGAVRGENQLQRTLLAVVAVEVGVLVDTVLPVLGGGDQNLVPGIFDVVDIPAGNRNQHIRLSGGKVDLDQLLL